MTVFISSILTLLFFTYYIPTPESHPPSIAIDDAQDLFTGEIAGQVIRTNKKVEFLFQIQQVDSQVLALHFMEDHNDGEIDALKQLKYGASCKVKGSLTVPDGARNPHQFDYKDYLFKKGITHQLMIESLDDITCESHSYLEYIYSLREKLSQITTDTLQSETVAWLHALVFGQDQFLDDDTIELFQRWSLSHILAISGLHIGIVVGILYLLFVRLSITTTENAQWFIMIFLPIYALLAGGQPSVWRASLMVLFVIWIQKVKVKYSYTDLVSMVFILLILMNKYIVYHIGFQLSFAVTFGLILSSKWILKAQSNLERILQISFVSQMMILPLQIHYFSTFQPLSILLNVIVVPYFSFFVIPAMFVLLVLIKFPTVLINLIENCFLTVHEFFLQLIEMVDTYAYYPMIIGNFPIYFALLYYVLFFMMMTYLEQKDTVKSFRYGVCMTVFILVLTLRPYFSPVGTVTMLDIGQGDAFILELPYRKGVFLMDAGASVSYPDFTPTDKVYKQIIRPYLHGQGIHKIDAIFLSHNDVDHVGSIEYLMTDIAVDEIIIGEFHELEETDEQLWKKLNQKVTVAHFNEVFMRKGQGFKALSPSRDHRSTNENSLVLYTELGGMSWLFTGDIGKETEIEMVKNYPALTFDVLKVGHHGSNTSTDKSFMKKTNPSYALISAGVNNRYGHPTKEVIQTLEEEAVTIYRTDLHGAVQYHFNDSHGTFSPFLNVHDQ